MARNATLIRVSDETTPKAVVTAWISGEIEGKPIVDRSALVDAAVEHFAKDPAFVSAFLAQMLRPMIYEIAKQVMKRDRPGEMIRELGAEIMADGEFKKRAKERASRWRDWLEHSGGTHIRLMEMTKADLQRAAAERRQRGDVEYAYAELWDALSVRLEGNEKVKERFTADEIERVRISLGETGEAVV